MITVSNLIKHYGKVTALDNVSFLFENKQVTAIMGENGAGKSTLLKICAGILPFYQGDVFIDGYSIKRHPLKARENIGYLPEMPNMYERLTGREFLVYLSSLRKMKHAETTIDSYAQELGMERFMDYEIGSYSKGMKQKISIIASMMHQPKNLLLDEPVWGLDPLTSRTLQDFIQQRQGTTIIATHSPDLVEAVADMVYIIMKGQVVAHGTKNQLLAEHNTIEELYFSVGEPVDA